MDTGADPTRLPRVSAVVAILSGALFLRVQGIDDQGFWIDEYASVLLAGDGPFPNFPGIRGDVHPPLYFSLLHYWMRIFGDSDAAVRMLSALASVAATGFLYRLGRLLYGPRTAWMVSFVAAISLLQIYYAQEARSYAWLMLFTVLSTDALIRWRIETRTRHALLYAFWTVALLYTHYFAFFFVVSQAIYILFVALGRSTPRRMWIGWALAVATAGALFVPWTGTLLDQVDSVRESFWIAKPTASAWLRAPLSFLSWWGPWSRASPIPYADIGLAFLGVAGILAGLWFLVGTRTVREADAATNGIPGWESTLLLALWLVVPIGSGLGMSLFDIEIFSYRNATVSACALLLLGAAACAHLASPLARSLWLAALVAPSVAQMPAYYNEPHKDQWCEAAGFVESRYQPAADAFVFDAPFIRYPFLSCSTLEDIDSVPVLAPRTPDYRRLWLVRGYAGPHSNSSERVTAWGYIPVERWQGVNVDVYLFHRDVDAPE